MHSSQILAVVIIATILIVAATVARIISIRRRDSSSQDVALLRFDDYFRDYVVHHDLGGHDWEIMLKDIDLKALGVQIPDLRDYVVRVQDLIGKDVARYESANRSKRKRRATIPSTRLWELGGLLFDHKTRARVYEPVINELKEDFLIANQTCRTPANYRWVRFCFGLRGSLAFLRCLRIAIMRPLINVIPARLRQLWKLFS
jgi:hypothetical protein